MAGMARPATTHPGMTDANAATAAIEETVDDHDHRDVRIAMASKIPMLLVAVTGIANERTDTEVEEEALVAAGVAVAAAAAGTETGEEVIETEATATVVVDAISAATITDLQGVTATCLTTDEAATTDATEDVTEGETEGETGKKTSSRKTAVAVVPHRRPRSESQPPTSPTSLLFSTASAA